MSRARLRILSETQVCRVLAAGGMLVESGGRWRAYRGQDARLSPAGCISPLIAERLQSEGVLRGDPQKPRRFLASRPNAVSPAASPPPSRLLETRQSKQPPALIDAIMADRFSKPGDLARIRAATQRFLGDIQAVSAPLSLRVGQGRGAHAARSRLATLENVIGLKTFRQLEQLLVSRGSAKAFARELALQEAEAYTVASSALGALVKAYDLAIQAP